MKTVAKAHTRLQTAVAALSVVVAGCGSNPPSAHSARAFGSADGATYRFHGVGTGDGAAG